MEVTTLDVAIIGAGPAGSAVARGLAGSGLRVGMIESGKMPRHKTCGGGVVGRVRKFLPPDFSSLVQAECHRAELVHHTPSMHFEAQRNQPVVSMVMRDEFDAWLARDAVSHGAHLFENSRVTEISRVAQGFAVKTTGGEFQVRLLVAADGANSMVARQLRGAPLRHLVPAFEVECTVAPEELARWKGRARFDFGFVPAGYAWVFPKRAHLSIGVLTTRRGEADLPHWFEKYCEKLEISPQRQERHGYIIPCSPREKAFAHPGVLFVGDAAGLADPVTAEGITAALHSGRLAAEAIRTGWPNDVEVRKCFRVLLEKSLLAELRWARRLAYLLYECPKIRRALWRWRGASACNIFTSIVTGEATYAELLGKFSHYPKLFFG